MSRIFIVVAAAMILPLQAFAQGPGDLAYCRHLAATYTTYIGRSEASTSHDVRRGSLDGQVAATQCQTRTAEAVRVLEQKLRNGGFTLPPRG